MLESEEKEQNRKISSERVVNENVIGSLKRFKIITERNHPIYETQVLTYLRLTGIKLGLLVNFGAPYVKDGCFKNNKRNLIDFLVSLSLRVFVFNLVEVLKEVY